MIIDCISDLHGFYPKLKGGDLLIIAGDLTAADTEHEYWKFNQYIMSSSHKYKKIIVIGGNHDNLLIETSDRHMAHVYCHPAEYLCDSATEFEGLKIWGTPWTLAFHGMNPHCKAFTVDSEEQLHDKFDLIPHDTDILITHTPPFGVLDEVADEYNQQIRRCGSKALYGWFKYVERPKLHVFGHIHEGYGQLELFNGYDNTKVKSVNASHVNERYQPINKPIRIIL